MECDGDLNGASVSGTLSVMWNKFRRRILSKSNNERRPPRQLLFGPVTHSLCRPFDYYLGISIQWMNYHNLCCGVTTSLFTLGLRATETATGVQNWVNQESGLILCKRCHGTPPTAILSITVNWFGNTLQRNANRPWKRVEMDLFSISSNLSVPQPTKRPFMNSINKPRLSGFVG